MSAPEDHYDVDQLMMSAITLDQKRYAEQHAQNRESFKKNVDWMIQKVNEQSTAVEHPVHYNKHPSGVECIDIVRHMSFNLGNAIKYIWRCDSKANAVEDLKKAIFYLQDEVKRREAQTP